MTIKEILEMLKNSTEVKGEANGNLKNLKKEEIILIMLKLH